MNGTAIAGNWTRTPNLSVNPTMSDPPSQLPPGFTLRKATPEDIWPIRRLVFGAKLDPTQLRWRQFWAIEREGKIIACGQLREFQNCRELGSLVVAASWRNRGLGTILTRHLIAESPEPLYLECVGRGLMEYYRRLGFAAIAHHDLPRPLKVKFALSHLANRLLKLPIFIMKQGEINN